mgnify:CR=1 FL=1
MNFERVAYQMLPHLSVSKTVVAGLNRLDAYNGAGAVIGLCLFVPAVLSVAAGEYSIAILLVTVGGGGTVSGAIYRSLRGDHEEFTISAERLPLMLSLACLSALATVVSVI